MSIYFWSVKILLEYRLIIVDIQILRLLIVLSTPNQCNNRKILHFHFINRKRRNFTTMAQEGHSPVMVLHSLVLVFTQSSFNFYRVQF